MPKLNKVKGLTIKTRLIFAFAVIMLIPSFAIGWISYQTAKNKVDEQMMHAASENVQLLNSTIDRFIEPEMYNIDYLADQMTNETMKDPDKLRNDILIPFNKKHPELSAMDFGAANGFYVNSVVAKMPDGYDPRVRPWYQDAMKDKGKVIITSPYVSKTTNDLVIGIAKVIKDGSGVVHCEVKVDTIAKITKEVQIGQEGYIYVIDKEGNYLIHPTAKIGTKASGPQYAKMFETNAGAFSYTLDGQPKKMSFETNQLTGWKLAGTWFTKEVTQVSQPILNQTLFVIVCSLVLGALWVAFIILSITRPLVGLVKVSEKISQGDLTEDVQVRSNDELGRLGNSFNQMTQALRAVIGEVGVTAEQLAASSEELTASAQQTSQATEQVAEITETVAAGSDKQVKSVKESVAAIGEMSAGIKQIASNSQAVSASAAEAAARADKGNESIDTAIRQMHAIHTIVGELSELVKGLGQRSEEIEHIIEVITAIASQTKLLALNAAIEAARAGEHGRGFAVVASEVGKLAEQSTQSADQITKLIAAIQGETKKAVESMGTGAKEVYKGIEVVHTAGESFKHIQQSIDLVSSQIREAAAAAQQVSAGTEQVVELAQTISEVAELTASGSQNVSAAAEEQLASMEEITASAAALAEMASELQNLVQKFKV